MEDSLVQDVAETLEALGGTSAHVSMGRKLARALDRLENGADVTNVCRELRLLISDVREAQPEEAAGPLSIEEELRQMGSGSS